MPAAAELAPLNRLELLLQSKAPSTRSNYVRIAGGFLASLQVAGDWPPGEEDAALYLKGVGERSDDLYNLSRAALRMLYRVNRWPFPEELTYRRVSPHDRDRPLYSPEEVRALIRAAATHPLGLARSIAALATTWGLRNRELVLVQARDLDLAARTFAVRTAKGGTQAVHLVPEEIARVLDPAAFAPPRSAWEVHGWLKSLARRAGIPPRAHEGAHCLRRALATGLARAGLSNDQVARFLRRKLGHGMEDYILLPSRDVDSAALLLHPFLPFWREALRA